MEMFILTTFISILLCCFVSSDDIIRLPMTRSSLSTPTISTRDGKQVNLKNVQNVAYSITIHVGKNLRPFVVQVDTGSADLFIPSIECKSCENHQRHRCLEKTGESVDLLYGLGHAGGPMCKDEVTIGGLTVRNQEFIVAEVVDEYLSLFPFDGIMGMAFIESSMGFVTPLIHNLFTQHKLPKKVFSFYLTSEGGGQSELNIGGSDPKHYHGNLSYVPVSSYEGKWEVPLEGFGIGGETVTDCNIYPCRVVIDTGNTDISVPDEPKLYFNQIYDTIKKAIPSVKRKTTTYFGNLQGFTLHIPHEEFVNLPSLDIYIAGKKFTLGPEDYKGGMSREYPGYRQLDLTSIPYNVWLFGDVFLRKAYTQYDIDNMRIGFAKPK